MPLVRCPSLFRAKAGESLATVEKYDTPRRSGQPSTRGSKNA
jgi:hypothetical protein